MIRRINLLAAVSVLLTPALAQEVPPAGFEIVNLTRDPNVRHDPRGLNNCGQLVYHARLEGSWSTSEVFLYDNGRTTRVTDNEDRDVFPGITENGRIYWLRGIGEGGVTQFVTLLDGEEVVIAENAGGLPYGVMNSQGQYAYAAMLREGCRGVDHVLVYFDGNETRVLRNGGSSAQLLDLNERGELVWAEFDFCQSPSGIDVYLYSDGVFAEIGGENDRASSPVINDSSQVAYSSQDLDTEWVTKLWEDGVSNEIIGDPTTPPRINDFGDVTFARPYPVGSVYQQSWMYEGDTEELVPLTQDDFSNGPWAINDYREVLIAGLEFGQKLQVRLLRRIRTGDSEFDGDIDHDDLAKLVDCMTGPMWVERTDPGPEDSLCECRFLDINHDGSVDLRDYARFQQNFGG